MEQGISDKILNHCVDSSANIKIDYDIVKIFKFSSFLIFLFHSIISLLYGKSKILSMVHNFITHFIKGYSFYYLSA